MARRFGKFSSSQLSSNVLFFHFGGCTFYSSLGKGNMKMRQLRLIYISREIYSQALENYRGRFYACLCMKVILNSEKNTVSYINPRMRKLNFYFDLWKRTRFKTSRHNVPTLGHVENAMMIIKLILYNESCLCTRLQPCSHSILLKYFLHKILQASTTRSNCSYNLTLLHFILRNYRTALEDKFQP